jgi:hypothetical protein
MLLPDMLAGGIEPGALFNLLIGLTELPEGDKAMKVREAIKLMVKTTVGRLAEAAGRHACPGVTGRTRAIGAKTGRSEDDVASRLCPREHTTRLRQSVRRK